MEQIVISKAQISVSDAGEVDGIAWVFGQPDSTGDLILPGGITFAKSVPMVMEHDEGRVIGIWSSHSETDTEMRVKGQLFLDGIAPARAARERLKSRTLSGLSVKFTSTDYEANTHGGTTFKSVTVSEISLCREPVHPGARITAVKAQPERTAMEQQQQETGPDIAALEDKIKGHIDRFETRMKAVETKANRPEPDVQQQTATEEKKAFVSYLRLGNQTPVEVTKALIVSSDTQGGYLAPAETSSEIIRDLIEFSPIRSIASVRSINSPSVKYPRRSDITNAKWEGELEEEEESNITFGQVEVTARKLMTFVDISNELLADSGGTAEAEVRQAFADDFGKKESTAFLLGNGQKEPEGLLTNSAIQYVANGHATNLSADAFISLFYALPAPYRNRGTWVLNGSTLAAIRKLKDGAGQYLWQPAFTQNTPETILGRPVIDAIDMPAPTSGLFPVLFGDVNAGYRIVDRLAMSILSDPYTQATRGVTRLHATRRVGGKVIQPKALIKLKMAVS